MDKVPYDDAKYLSAMENLRSSAETLYEMEGVTKDDIVETVEQAIDDMDEDD